MSNSENKEIIYVVGDMHADLQVLVNLLTKVMMVATVNPETYESDWVENLGRRTTLIFLGDMVDRNRPGYSKLKDGGRRTCGEIPDEEIKMQKIINDLSLKAKNMNNGHKVIKILGNHEIMIAKNERRYSSKMGSGDAKFRKLLNCERKEDMLQYTLIGPVPENTKIIHEEGDWIFLHAGLDKKYGQIMDRERLSIDKLNDIGRKIIGGYNCKMDVLNKEELRLARKFILDAQDSPVWDRKMGNDFLPDAVKCNKLDEVFDVFFNQGNREKRDVSKMKVVIGHTTQNKALRVDGIIKPKYKNNKEIVGEIRNIKDVRREKPLYVFHNDENENDNKDLIKLDKIKKYDQMTGDIIGINYVCPMDPKRELEGGRIYRIDTAMSRGFDGKMEPSIEMKQSRSPQCLVIERNGGGEERVYVLKFAKFDDFYKCNN